MIDNCDLYKCILGWLCEIIRAGTHVITLVAEDRFV